MAKIKRDFGVGGANVVPGKAQGDPGLAEVLRDIADDLASLKADVAAIDGAAGAGAGLGLTLASATLLTSKG